MENKYPIIENWKEYYDVLEGIRRTGYCNMWGASPLLKEFWLVFGDICGLLSRCVAFLQW